MSRLKKPSDLSEAATSIQQKDPGLVDDGSSVGFSGFGSDEEQDKDSMELELEKAVFGDEIGFHEHLKQHGTIEDGPIDTTAYRGTHRENAEDEIQDNIQDIADADVRSPATAVQLLPQRSSFSSSSSLILDLLQEPVLPLVQIPMPAPFQTSQKPYGMIAMTTV